VEYRIKLVPIIADRLVSERPGDREGDKNDKILGFRRLPATAAPASATELC